MKRSLVVWPKYFIFIMTLAVIPFSFGAPRQLSNKIIRWFDGVKNIMDGDKIKGMIYIFGQLRKMQYGAKDADTGAMKGMFTLNSQQHTLRELARFENELEREFERQKEECAQKYLTPETMKSWKLTKEDLQEKAITALKQEEERVILSLQEKGIHNDDKKDEIENFLIKIRQVSYRNLQTALVGAHKNFLQQHARTLPTLQEELTQIEAEYNQKLGELQPLLRKAKDTFKAINGPYIDSAKGAKNFLEKLIIESCKLRGLKDSFLFDWAQVPEGQEMESFEKNITTLRQLDTACTDLSNFLTDVMASCPKACAQAGVVIPK